MDKSNIRDDQSKNPMKDKTKSKQSKTSQRTRFIFGREMTPDQILGAIKKMAKGAGIKVVNGKPQKRPKRIQKKSGRER